MRDVITTDYLTRHLATMGIEPHAQVQQYKGRTVEFHPEHLGCELCWMWATTALTEATMYARFGPAQGSILDNKGHGIAAIFQPTN
jgi:hypothetical protein